MAERESTHMCTSSSAHLPCFGFLEGVDGVHGVAAVAERGARHRRLAVLVLRHVEQGGEEEEDAEGDGHDVSRELTAGVDGRAACVCGKDRGKAREDRQ